MSSAALRPRRAEPRPGPSEDRHRAPGAELGAPSRASLWAAVVYSAATLTLAYPALAGLFLVNPYSDQYIAGYAFREFGARVLRETGGFALWNPFLFGGMPFVAAMHGDIFYPTFLLRLALPTDVAMTWSFIVHVFLAGWFTFRFARALGVGFHASLVGGLAYMLGGNVAGLVSPGHDGKLAMCALLPLALLLVLRGVRDGRAWAWGALAVTVGLAVLTPHPQVLQYLLLCAGAFALFVAFADRTAPAVLPRPVALRRLGLALAAVLVGALIGAVQYLPVREYVAWSPRAVGMGWERAISYSLPIEEIANMYVPQFTGILDRYWGRNGIHLHSEYLGAAVLVLAPLAFGAAGTARRRLMWFWGTTLLVSLLWALGGHTPFYRLVYLLVPGTKFFRAPSTMLYVVAFSVAMLAAFGVDRALSGAVRARYAVGWIVAALAVALLGTGGALTTVAASIARQERLDLVYANASALAVGSWRSFVFVALAGATLAGIARRRLSGRAAGWALAAIVGADLWSVERLYWRFSPPAAQLYAVDATIDYVARQPSAPRVLALQLGPSAAVHDPFLNGDALMVHGIREVLGYHGNEIGRYDMLWGERDGGRQLGNPNFWKLANIGYLLTNTDEPPFPGMRRVAGPVTNAAGSTVSLFAMPGENPGAWVAPAIVKAPDDAVLNTVLDPRFDVRTVALFDTSATVRGQSVNAMPAPLAITAAVSRPATHRIVVRLSAPAPANSALVVSENYYPGWSATADGTPVPLGRADVSLIGVALPPGTRTVDLRFRSAAYEVGKGITLFALLMAVIAWVAGYAADRRRRA